MPHLILETCSDLENKTIIRELFINLRGLLVEQLPTDDSSFKCRSFFARDILIGDGSSNQYFAHLTIKVLPGREMDKLKMISLSCFDIMKNTYKKSFPDLNIKISLEIVELSDFYCKN